MRHRFFSPSRRHQLIFSLAPASLRVLHLCRTWKGWVSAHEVRVALTPVDDSYLQLPQIIEEALRPWQLPDNVQAFWVLCGDILGIAAPEASGEVQPASALPFAANEVLTQVDHFTKSTPSALMWIHKDWADEIERICAHCHLELVEIFSRAQLFQGQAPTSNGALRVVLEQDEGEQFLHIYSSNGGLLRSKALKSPHAHTPSELQLELAVLGRRAPLQVRSTAESAKALPEGLDCQIDIQPPWNPSQLLKDLWRSDREGVEIRPTHLNMLDSIKFASLFLAVAGLLGLGLMIWHDGKLEQQLEDGRAQARKDLPKVEAAKALKARTLQMDDLARADKALSENNSPMQALPTLFANFPPPPASLIYVLSNQNSLHFAGSGDESSVNWLKERKFEGFGPLEDWAVPDELSAKTPAIHAQLRRSPEASAHPRSAPASSPSSTDTAKTAR